MKSICRRILLAAGALAASAPVFSQAAKPVERPGFAKGSTLLPSGWRIAPAGRHMTVGDLPLAMAENPGGRFLAVTTNGYVRPALVVVDLKNFVVKHRLPVDNAWLGLAWSPDGSRLYSSGAAANTVEEYAFEAGRLKPSVTIKIGEPHKKKETVVGGIAASPDGGRLYAVNVFGQTLSAIDLARREVLRTVPLPAEPYTCLVSPDGRTLFVSLWGGAKVLLFDTATLEKTAEVAVGEHPNAMVLSLDGLRLFVACANTNAVWVVDLARRSASEQISVALYPNSPAGSTPNGLGLSPDGSTLLVANADTNMVAVASVAAGESRVSGFLPAGWYPTAAAFTRDGKNILVLSGKGLASSPNPRGPHPSIAAAEGQFIGALLAGSLSLLPVPDRSALAKHTKTVYDLTAYRDSTKLSPARAPKGSAIPARVGAPSPIKHVFYVIRENRSYDQVFGDIPEGNGDPYLCLYGEDVTPNAHALAREFVLLDNFYVNAEVSYDGHAYSTGAYATDAVEKIWPMNYGDRGGRYLSEGGGEMRNPYGNLDAPAEGYIWDACVRAGVSVRSYGEFVVDPAPARDRDAERQVGQFISGPGPYKAAVPGLEGRIHPFYPPFDLSIPDSRRVDIWLEEFRKFEKDGGLPALSILRLGGDHTSYLRAGYPTPRSMIAENDQALGRIVEEISKSPYWKESAIFVLEDDAQNGPDHVDAHRSVALVASPYARRRAVDSSLYTTCAMLRTIELILALPPMNQCDAAAAPMYGAFRTAASLAPYRLRPARVPTDEMNDPAAPAAKTSALLNLDEADRVPDIAGNEILWKAERGEDCPMPPPVRAAFVRRAGE